ncbi:hypothetical protein [Azospirillum sp. sgz302134]
MIHKILDKLDRLVAQKREAGALDAWIESGSARRYCQKATAEQKHYYTSLMLYLESHVSQA